MDCVPRNQLLIWSPNRWRFLHIISWFKLLMLRLWHDNKMPIAFTTRLSSLYRLSGISPEEYVFLFLFFFFLTNLFLSFYYGDMPIAPVTTR